MGKRSDFERIDKDFYRTIDPKASAVLASFLKPCTYCEPCYGKGDLVKQLYTHGFSCWANYDIEKDALTLTKDDLNGAGCIITNPPWGRPILHKMIDHFAHLAPTWLLFDADWPYTKQEIIAKKHGVKTVPELMKMCSDIIPIGRLTWIPGTAVKGKDNCAWYRFDANNSKETIFHGR